MDAIQIGAAGLAAASARFDASAQRTVAGGDPVAETVERITDSTAFAASLAVVRTGDAMVKRLLDLEV